MLTGTDNSALTKQVRIPIAAPPRLDESPASWIGRLAAGVDVDPRWIATAVGLGSRHGVDSCWRTGLSARQARLLNRLTGTNTRDIQQLGVHTLWPDVEVPTEQVERHQWLSKSWLRFDYTSAFCPTCLSHESVWRTTWMDSFHVACEQHKSWLVEACHECGERPGSKQVALGATCRCERQFADHEPVAISDVDSVVAWTRAAESDNRFETYADLVIHATTADSVRYLPVSLQDSLARVLADRDAPGFKLRDALSEPRAMAAVALLVVDLRQSSGDL